MKKQKAFTLIEILVVVAIIGLLSSIILVAIKGVREKARITAALQFSASVHHALGADAVGIWDFNENARDTCQTTSPNDVCDFSGNDNHGELYGGINWTTERDTPSQSGYALSFDGNDDYVVVSSFDGLRGATQFTIEFWARFNTPQDYIFWRDEGWLTEVQATRYRFRFNLDDSWRTSFYIDHIIGKWHHVAITWDGDWTKGYINGELKLDSNSDGAYSAMSDNSNSLNIGHRSGYFNGFIDEVRIYEQALTSTQIKKLYVEEAKERGLVEK